MGALDILWFALLLVMAILAAIRFGYVEANPKWNGESSTQHFIVASICLYWSSLYFVWDGFLVPLLRHLESFFTGLQPGMIALLTTGFTALVLLFVSTMTVLLGAAAFGERVYRKRGRALSGSAKVAHTIQASTFAAGVAINVGTLVLGGGVMLATDSRLGGWLIYLCIACIGVFIQTKVLSKGHESQSPNGQVGRAT